MSLNLEVKSSHVSDRYEVKKLVGPILTLIGQQQIRWGRRKGSTMSFFSFETTFKNQGYMRWDPGNRQRENRVKSLERRRINFQLS